MSTFNTVGIRGENYTGKVTATGGDGNYEFHVNSAPPFLTIDRDGNVSGIPDDIGIYTINMYVYSAGKVDDGNATLTVRDTIIPESSLTPEPTPTPTPTPSVTPSGIANVILSTTDVVDAKGVLNTPYASQLNASGGNGVYTYSVWSGTLPAGLTLNPANGIISGTPTAFGSFEIGFRVDSGSKNDVDLVTIYVYEEALDMWFGGAVNIDTETSIEVVVNPSGGLPPYTTTAPSVTVATYPELVFDASIPYFYGYIRVPGVYTIPVILTDSVGGTITKNVVFTVTQAPNPSPTPSPSLSPTPTPTPTMTPVPEDNRLFYIESNVSDSVPADGERAIDPTGFIYNDKLMIRNSYFMIGKDESGNPVELNSKIITLDHADELNKFTIALHSNDGYDMTKIAYTGPNANPDIKYSNFSYLPRSNTLIMAESNIATGTFLMHMWKLTDQNTLDWSNTPVGATIPVPTNTITLTPMLRSVLIGSIDRLYVDKAHDDTNGTIHDRIYFITKTVATVAGEILIMTAINYDNGDGTYSIQEAPARYLAEVGEYIGSTSQPPNPNFTVIFTVNEDNASVLGLTTKILAKRYESLIGSDFVVSDVEYADLPTFSHVTTSADFSTMLASSYKDNVIFSFDPYTFAYLGEMGQVVGGQPTTVVNYDYIRTNIVPTDRHAFFDATSHSPWSKIDIINYDDALMNMTYLHYDEHRLILRAQSWKYATDIENPDDVVSTYMGFVGIRDVIPELPTPTPTSSPMSSPTATPTQTAAVTPSKTPPITPTITPTISASSSVTPTPTPTKTGTVTPSVSMSVTPSITQTVTPTITNTPSADVTPTPSSSSIPTLVLDVSGVPAEGMDKIPFEGSLVATGGPNPRYIFSVDPSAPLPDGLSVDVSTGKVSGTPTVVGTFTVKFTVESTPFVTTVSKTITINPFDISFDGMAFTTAPEDFKNHLDGTVMPAEPTETFDAGSF